MSTTITRDYSLKDIGDGRIGKLPKAMLAAILTQGNRDESGLAQQALFLGHPELKGKMPDAKSRQHAALARELSRIQVRHVRPLIWLRQIVGLLDRYRGDIPREFLLGWMAIESDGSVKAITSRPERGYFQIDWKGGEAQEQLKLTQDQFVSLSTDREYSIRVGIQLAQIYRQYVRKHYTSVPDGSELMWRLTKARHGASGILSRAMTQLAKAHQTVTWESVAAQMAQTKLGRMIVENVEHLFRYYRLFKPLAALIPLPADGGTTPELEEEARGFRRSGFLRPRAFGWSGGFTPIGLLVEDPDTGIVQRPSWPRVNRRLDSIEPDGSAFDDSAVAVGTSWVPGFRARRALRTGFTRR